MIFIFPKNRYPIFPWVLAEYNSVEVDITGSANNVSNPSTAVATAANNTTWRDLVYITYACIHKHEHPRTHALTHAIFARMHAHVHNDLAATYSGK